MGAVLTYLVLLGGVAVGAIGLYYVLRTVKLI